MTKLRSYRYFIASRQILQYPTKYVTNYVIDKIFFKMYQIFFADKNMAISRAYGVLKEDEGLRFEILKI